MSHFTWRYELPPGFEFDCIDYVVDDVEPALHRHDYCQLALCTDGQGQVVIGQQVYPCCKGDLFTIDRMELHEVRPDGEHRPRFLFLVFRPQFVVRPSAPHAEFGYLLPLIYRPPGYCHKVDHDAPCMRRLCPLLLDIAEENRMRRPGWQYLITAKLRVALAELIGHLGLEAQNAPCIDRYIQLQAAVEFIDQHFTESLTLSQVARSTGLSASRFRRVFHQALHVGFKEYVIDLRYHAAKRLLVTTDHNVSDIAAQAGFSNLYSFYKLFEERERLTPNAFRKLHRL